MLSHKFFRRNMPQNFKAFQAYRIEGAFKKYQTLLFLLKLMPHVQNPFRWEVMSPFLCKCENFCASRQC